MTSHHHHGHPPFRNGLIHQASNKKRLSDELPDFASQYIPTVRPDTHWRPASRTEPQWTVYRDQLWRYLRAIGLRASTLKLRDILDVRFGLILVWVIVLWWGEEHLFQAKVEGCAWDRWESWVCDYETGIPCSQISSVMLTLLASQLKRAHTI